MCSFSINIRILKYIFGLQKLEQLVMFFSFINLSFVNYLEKYIDIYQNQNYIM